MKQQASAGRDRVLAALILAGWAAAALALHWNDWAADLSALLIAGALWDSGQPELIYAAREAFFSGAPAAWDEIRAGLGISGRGPSFPYVYPPLWAVLAAPLTQMLAPQAFLNAVMAVQVPMLAAAVVLAGRIARPPGMSRTVWALWGVAVLTLSMPGWLALMLGQPSITVAFLTLLSVERLKAGRPLTAGAVLALAAAIKLSPAILALIFVIDRAPRALAGFAGAGAALAGASVALAGWPLHADFLESLARVGDLWPMSALNLSLGPALLALGGWAGFWPLPAPPGAATPPDLLALAVKIALPVAAAVLVLRARRWPRDAALAGGALGLAILGPWLGPLGWQHYYIPTLLLIPGLARLIPARAAWTLAGLALAITARPVMVAAALAGDIQLIWPVVAGAVWLAVLAALALARPRP